LINKVAKQIERGGIHPVQIFHNDVRAAALPP
jgi:hypothetical protein